MLVLGLLADHSGTLAGGLAGGLAGDFGGTRPHFGGLALNAGSIFFGFAGDSSETTLGFYNIKRGERVVGGGTQGELACRRRHASKILWAPWDWLPLSFVHACVRVSTRGLKGWIVCVSFR